MDSVSNGVTTTSMHFDFILTEWAHLDDHTATIPLFAVSILNNYFGANRQFIESASV